MTKVEKLIHQLVDLASDENKMSSAEREDARKVIVLIQQLLQLTIQKAVEKALDDPERLQPRMRT